MSSRLRMGILAALGAASWAGAALGAGAPLADDTLDAVTAGTAAQPLASGGAVVGNNSEAVLNITGTLDLAGDAQLGAMGLNVVNSSESTVANGVNVWDGKIDVAAQAERATFEVNQTNTVEQEQRRVAFLPSYERSGVNSSSEWDENSSHIAAQTLDTRNETLDVESLATTRALTSSGSVSTETTVAGQTIRGGRGIAGAGDLAVNFDGGDIDLVIEGSIGGDILEGSIALNIGLPELDIAFNGGGCAVQMGSCTGEGSLNESTTEERDNSVIETLASTSNEHDTFIGGGSETIRSPFAIEDAQAEYIVVDDSKIDVDSNYGITLAGSAQSNLRALNAVNAAGSAVANGVNISRTPTLSGGQTLALNQQNIIRHSR